MDLGLQLKDVGRIVNATTSTVTNLEKSRTSPRRYLLPKIYGFLGYNPLVINSKSFGKQIRLCRIQNGLSLRKMARELGVDPDTVAKWETMQRVPKPTILERLKN